MIQFAFRSRVLEVEKEHLGNEQTRIEINFDETVAETEVKLKKASKELAKCKAELEELKAHSGA